MGFTIDQSDSYKWPIKISIPQDGGRMEPSTFDGEFKRVTQSRIREMGEMIDKGELSDYELVAEVLIGWKGITDSNGEEIKFSQTNLQKLVDVPMAATSIAEAFFNSIAGAKRKN